MYVLSYPPMHSCACIHPSSRILLTPPPSINQNTRLYDSNLISIPILSALPSCTYTPIPLEASLPIWPHPTNSSAIVYSSPKLVDPPPTARLFPSYSFSVVAGGGVGGGAGAGAGGELELSRPGRDGTRPAGTIRRVILAREVCEGLGVPDRVTL